MKTDTFAKKHGHPPVANKVVCIDLDNTIIPWGPLLEVREPFYGVVEMMQKLRDEGYYIVIFTSRYSQSWWQAEAIARGVTVTEFAKGQRAHVRAILKAAGIPYDKVTAEKVPAMVYFDDKAVQVAPGRLSMELDAWLWRETHR